MNNANVIFDDTLFSILEESKTLPNFFDVIFGFLKRRTDFYCIAEKSNSPVGLPLGWAEHFVKEAFFKWKPRDKNGDVLENLSETMYEEVIESSDAIESIKEREHVNDTIIPLIECNESLNKGSTSYCNFTTAESYNGSVFEGYSWSQTVGDIDIIVNLPENVATKDLSVIILPRTITVKCKNSNKILLNGELCQKVKHNEAIWSLDKRKLEIHLEKLVEMWWDCLIQSEPKLDVTKIDCSRPFEDLSDEAQAKIEELTWNQERKRLGLPTSDQMVLEQKLKKAWDVEGSPFKGSFDPNTVIIHQ